MKRFVHFSIFLFYSLNIFGSAAEYAFSSVLSSGQWFRIAVISEGVYRIDYSALKSIGLSDPSSPRIFGNNQGQLSYYNDGTAGDDLTEMAIYLSTGSDGVFNEGDYLLFYGQGTHRWKYDQSLGFSYLRHNYSDTAYYFLTSGAGGKRIMEIPHPQDQLTGISSHSDALYIHEVEKVNLIKSGRDWFQPVSALSMITVNPGFTNVSTEDGIKLRIRVAARSSTTTSFGVYEGSTLIKNIISQPVNLFNYTGTYASVTDSSGVIHSANSSPEFEIRFNNNGNTAALGWLDYISLQARTMNKFDGSQAHFRDSRSVSPGSITSFNINSQLQEVVIWDVTDPMSAGIIKYTRDGNNLTFKSRTDSLRTFIAFSPESVQSANINPLPLPNQDLHSSPAADMIIVTHPYFIKYAEALSLIHLRNSGLECQVVTPGQIYNEFSGGIRDIAAIRNFVRMKYIRQNGTSRPLKYLLLFGDGSYENKTLPPLNPNFIPTYQSQNSNVIVSSFTSDDFYGLLEDGEGEAAGTEDIGIGRFPVSDTVQAGILISKIRKYMDPGNTGDWKNIISIVADDEDGNAHMTDAEGLDIVLSQEVPEYNVQKIYLDAFRQVSTVSGQSYPEVNKAINDRISSGCLIFNYVGHGSENGLAHERVVKTDDINSWKNGAKLPLFITATCEFSRFDDVETNTITGEMTDRTSAGEMALKNRKGGCIALMSTTRVVYSAPNFFLNRNIFSCAFDRDSSGNPLRLGDIIRIAKNNSGNGANKRNFSLLGDPALILAYPWHGKVITDSLNHVLLSEGTDSLKALSLVTVSGHIEDPSGLIMNNFNGIVSPIVYDKESKVKTLANDGGSVMEFSLRNNIIFSGKTHAKGGKFSFTFIVPRDIDYSFGNGKISYYANDEEQDMNGSCTSIIVGGFSKTDMADTTGPRIRLFMNDTLFRDGGMTDASPTLYAIIEDPGGINTTGAGIGHDLTGFIDSDRNESIVLNNYYVNDFDNYSRGSLRYELAELSRGTHTFTVKAWDNYNNSSEETIEFIVEENGRFILRNLVNYPNPVTKGTTFSGEINRTDGYIDVVINIYNLNGKIIKSINTKLPSTGYTLPPIEWDGTADNGGRVARGLYLYVVNLTTEDGESTRESGRMIIL